MTPRTPPTLPISPDLPCMPRRDFVRVCATTLVAMGLGACATMPTQRVPLRDGVVTLPLSRYPELRAPDGAIRIVPDGTDDELFVIALAGGEYSVLSPICTHLGCTVELEGERLVCPCHGSTYDLRGSVLRGPAEEALTRYPARVEGDSLVIALRTAR